MKRVSKKATTIEKTLELTYEKDDEGELLDGGEHRYLLKLGKETLQSINSFWSVALYKMPGKSLVKNARKKYLINSFMLPQLQRHTDGSLTIYLQKNYPGENKESNWLPVPEGPFLVVVRLHWPHDQVVEQSWKALSIKKSG
jgi:hypothetical protein